jgi:hypothetical protein
MSHDGTFFKAIVFRGLAGRIHEFLTIGAELAASGALCKVTEENMRRAV